MTDRKPGQPGRWKGTVTVEEAAKISKGEPFNITLERNDEPITPGTPYNKASVLPDDLATKLNIEEMDPAPKDAFEALYKHDMHLYSATFTADGWAGDDETGYTQTAACTPQDGGPDVTAATQLGIPMAQPTGVQDADEALQEALAIINAGTSTPGDGTVSVKVWEKPETEIEVFWYGR